jgi:tRNA-dihydrouridine synthase B
MIGRGTLGNPWIFKQIQYYLKTNEKMPEISITEKYNVIMEHFDLLLKQKGEYTATREIRKHTAWYVKGMKNASIIKDAVNKVETKEEFQNIIKEYFQSI